MKYSISTSLKMILAFAAVYVVWGTSYLANVFALKDFPPFILIAFRYCTAGAILAVYSLFAKLTWPSFRQGKVVAISGVLMLVGGSGLVAYAQLYIGSGYAAAITATEPLWFVLLDSKRWRLYFSNAYIVGGLVTGFAGIACFSILQNKTGTNHWTGTLVLLIGAVLWVVGTLYGEYHHKKNVSIITTTAVQLFSAAGVSVVITIVKGEWSQFGFFSVSTQSWSGLAYLILMGSIVAFMAYNWLVKVQPPAIVSTYTFVNPIVAILMGVLIVGEKITLMQGIVLAGALSSVFVIQLKKPKSS